MRRCALALVTAVVATLLPVSSAVPPRAQFTRYDGPPQVVVALIDTGINPYSPAFRDRSKLAQQHPSTYLPGYRKNVKALELHLNEKSIATALRKDKKIWARVESRKLYWIPGTKIVGVISMGAGGRRCRATRNGVEAPWVPPVAPVSVNQGANCPERMILDDHGHGTMTASRAVGVPHSLAPEARVVMIESLGADRSEWAADQPWIDVQSNSWGSFVPAPADTGNMNTFSDIAKGQMVLVASGNGLAFSGAAPQPTYTDGLGAPGVVLVGGHDNGRVTAWGGAPAHVVADAFAPFTAIHNSLSKMRPDPVACCTSTAAPYAAGAAAAILLEARRILEDPGYEQGPIYVPCNGGCPTDWEFWARLRVVASGRANRVSRGPLKDGEFTLAEWRAVLMKTAEARPREGRDDGTLHFLGAPGEPHYADPWGTGENPYCQFCWTLPVEWPQVPAEFPGYASIGYGAVNERSIALAFKVLRGKKALPARADEDAFFAQDDAIRGAIWP